MFGLCCNDIYYVQSNSINKPTRLNCLLKLKNCLTYIEKIDLNVTNLSEFITKSMFINIKNISFVIVNILLKRNCNMIMSYQDKKEIQLFFDKLSNEILDNKKFFKDCKNSYFGLVCNALNFAIMVFQKY